MNRLGYAAAAVGLFAAAGALYALDGGSQAATYLALGIGLFGLELALRAREA
ncbi:MAG: hypothetical protein ABEJ70_07180 [Halobacteriaceae archaeon]